jgi:predicted transposase YdaD
MAKPYDSVFKDLLERDPAGWVKLALGTVSGTPALVDSDIAMTSGAADKVVRLEQPHQALVHFEAFAAWDATVLPRAMNYNAAHHRRHLLPVETVLVVLRPEADHASLTGEYRVQSPLGRRVHLLEYAVVRAWKLDLETVLEGPLGTLPLAPITDAAADRLPEVLRRMETRLAQEAPPETRKDLWADTYVLLGLRYSRRSVAQLFRGIPAVKESDTYQAILEEGVERGRAQGREVGRVEEAIRALLIVGTARLGEADGAVRRRIEAETDLNRLEEWLRHVARVESWSELPGF